MTIIWHYAITILLYPGGLFALLAGWVLFALGEKLLARWRGMRPSLLTQPAHDVLKLLGKTTSLPAGAETGGLRALPLVGVVAPLLAIILMPLPGNLAANTVETSGDVLAVLLLLVLPALLPFFLGQLQASPYARIAAQRMFMRSAVLLALVLLSAGAVAAQRGSLSLGALSAAQTQATAASIALDMLAGLLFWLCLPALQPAARWGQFSGDLALIAGPYTDLAGADLALLQLGAMLQRVATGSFLVVLFIQPFLPDNLALQVSVYLATLLISGLWVSLAGGVSRRYSLAR